MLIQYMRPNIHDAYGVKFTPGVNDIPVDKWEKELSKDSEIKRLVEEGHMIVLKKDAKDAKEADKTPSLLEFSEKKAIKFVQETWKDELLAEWESHETRPAVKRAISEKRAELAKDAAKRAEKK